MSPTQVKLHCRICGISGWTSGCPVPLGRSIWCKRTRRICSPAGTLVARVWAGGYPRNL